MAMHFDWLPYRLTVHERQGARGLQQKVGRNERRPCASGEKFKRCCGGGGSDSLIKPIKHERSKFSLQEEVNRRRN